MGNSGERGGRDRDRDIERPENSPVDCFQWFERPENCPVDSFQRERVGRPLSMGPAGPWKVDLTKNACIVSSKTEEVVSLRENRSTIDTVRETTSSDPALRPAHLPLNRSLRSLGKAFGCGSSYSCSLFPIPWDEVPAKSEFPTD